MLWRAVGDDHEIIQELASQPSACTLSAWETAIASNPLNVKSFFTVELVEVRLE